MKRFVAGAAPDVTFVKVFLSNSRSLKNQQEKQTGEQEMAAMEEGAKRWSRGRLLAVALSSAIMLTIAAAAVVFALSGTGAEPILDGSEAVAHSRPSTLSSRFSRITSPTLVADTTPAQAGDERPALGPEPLAPAAPPAVIPIPENVNAAPEFLALAETLRAEIEAYSAEVGGIDVAIAVTDLQNGQTISVNGNALHKTGCTINMFALFAATDLFQAGLASPESVAYSIKVGIGGSYPPEVKNFLQSLYGSYQGGVSRAQELMRAWGLQTSLFDHVPYYGDGTQNNYLTALEANLVLVKLYRGELYSPEWTAYTLARLRDIKYGLNYILPGRLPAVATVAHKIGYHADYDGWVNNDAGIVTFTGIDGQTNTYVITYLSQQAQTEYIGYSFGAYLSRIVWDHLGAKYGVLPPPPPPPTPTPEPMPTVTPTPTPTPEPTPTPTPTPRPPSGGSPDDSDSEN